MKIRQLNKPLDISIILDTVGYKEVINHWTNIKYPDGFYYILDTQTDNRYEVLTSNGKKIVCGFYFSLNNSFEGNYLGFIEMLEWQHSKRCIEYGRATEITRVFRKIT